MPGGLCARFRRGALLSAGLKPHLWAEWWAELPRPWHLAAYREREAELPGAHLAPYSLEN